MTQYGTKWHQTAFIGHKELFKNFKGAVEIYSASCLKITEKIQMRHFEEFFNIVNLAVFDFSYHSKTIWTFNKIIISTFWSPCLAWSHKLRYALIELDELVWWKFSAWRDNKLSLDFGPKL